MIASMGAVGLSGFGGSGNNQGAPVFEDTEPEEETGTEGMSWPEGPVPVVDGSKPHVATLQTNKGDIKINLSTAAPETVNSFAFLAGNGFYNGTVFFFVDKEAAGFAQAGDPTCALESETVCSGLGGPDYTLKVENPEGSHDEWAVVAPYVSEGESAHGSQFRILFAPAERLDGKETVFGTVEDAASREILRSLSDFQPCTLVDSETCNDDLSQALVIEDVTVEPA